jgi:hypothetical protein
LQLDFAFLVLPLLSSRTKVPDLLPPLACANLHFLERPFVDYTQLLTSTHASAQQKRFLSQLRQLPMPAGT